MAFAAGMKGLFSGGLFKTLGENALEGAMAGGLGATAWGIGPGDHSFGGIVAGAATGALFGMAGGAGGRYGARRAKEWADAGSGWNGRTLRQGNSSVFIEADATRLEFTRWSGVGVSGGSPKPGKTRGLKYSSMGAWGARGAGALGGVLGLGWGNNLIGNSRRRKHMSSLNHYGETF